VEVNRCLGQDLGIDLTYPDLKVVNVSWQGLIAQWNIKAQFAVTQIRSGDRIIGANTFKTMDEIVSACKRKSMLYLIFLRRVRKNSPQKPMAKYVFEDKLTNPVLRKIKRNLVSYAYNYGGLDYSALFHGVGDHQLNWQSGLISFDMFNRIVRKQGKISLAELSNKDLYNVFMKSTIMEMEKLR
jgi:hypothetical protein